MSELNISRSDSKDHLSFKGKYQQYGNLTKLGLTLYIQSPVYQNSR